MKKGYEKCLRYIEKYWDKSTFELKKNSDFHLGLPKPFVAPNQIRFNKDQFYWDSYFIILGLLESGKTKLAKGMVENFAYLFENLGFIPSRNRYYNTVVSQIPFLTSMITEVFEKTKDREWLKEMAIVAENELEMHWKYCEEEWKSHMIYRGLSRYCDRYASHKVSEHESGWDMTSRFKERCMDYIPVDLNSCLYKYEKDLEWIYKLFGKNKKSKKYSDMAEKRKRVMRSLMWNTNKGFYFDFNYKKTSQSNFYSLAGFFPLWAEIASKRQADKIVKNIKRFEYGGGLATTQKRGIHGGKQWDYPNGWAPLHWITIKGLLNYGFKKEAKRIGEKWLEMNKDVFLNTGKFWEKYDVVEKDLGNNGRYPVETGFGWTNAIFLKLYNTFN